MNAMKLVACLVFFYASVWTCSAIQPKATILVPVGVVLDAGTWIGKLGLSCIHSALSDFYASHSYYKTRLVLNVKDSKTEVIGAALAAVDLIKNVEVKAIIGPQGSRQTNFVIDVGHKSQVPIISFSATSPSLTHPQRQSPYFFRVAQNEAAQVQAISAIVQAFEWKQAVLIYIQGIYEGEVIPSMIRALEEANVHVPYQSAISPSATDQQILQELIKLKMMANGVFIVHVSPELGSRLFTLARNNGMMSQGYAWIITSKMTNLLPSMNSSATDSMQGVLGVSSYYPKTRELEGFEAQWKMKFQREYPSIIGAQMNVFGLWAYDAATALAMAVEQAGATNLSFQKTNASSNATNFEALGVSQIGPKLGEALSKTRFKGLAGEFSFVNGEVNSSAVQIINLIGDGKRVVGYWTPQNGLERKMESRSMGTYSTSKTNLGPIIWPGDSSSAPKCWYVLANTKKLRVGVPVKAKNAFNEFVDVQHDPATKITTVSGFCIDVFVWVMGALPCHVLYEFVPYNPLNDLFKEADYDDLIYQTYLGNFDAVAGDFTITAERSQYVDFTLPFTESGTTFMVPTQEKYKKNAWIFLKPLTWELWLTTGCFFVFIGFVVWMLEHRVNEEFRGSPSYQVGTSFWFSFSTLVFAQRERVHSNLARFVVIIWVFVVLILTQSYTAGLTTLLTVQQLRPAVTDVNQLLQNGEYVGYQAGSHSYQILIQMGFDESKLRAYKTVQQCDQLLTMGSHNGGVAAVFDEIPYLKVIMATYCSKYATMGPTFRTAGFGFAFRRNSDLVPHVSRAILNLTDGTQGSKKEIERKWGANETRTQNSDEVDASYSLDLNSFRGLFLLAAVASLFALIIHTATFLYGRWQRVFMQFHPNDSLWKKIHVMFRIFDQKDIIYYGSEKNREQFFGAAHKIHHIDSLDADPLRHTSRDQVPQST